MEQLRKQNTVKEEKLLDHTINTNKLLDEHSFYEEKFDFQPLVLWTDLTLYDKVRLFSIWSVVGIISGIL